jgi:hypothetical protein
MLRMRMPILANGIEFAEQDDGFREGLNPSYVLSTVLRIKRTLDGAEIDQIILDLETRKALAAEHRRRADWRKCELAAERFRAQCHADAATLPHPAPDRVQ